MINMRRLSQRRDMIAGTIQVYVYQTDLDRLEFLRKYLEAEQEKETKGLSYRDVQVSAHGYRLEKVDEINPSYVIRKALEELEMAIKYGEGVDGLTASGIKIMEKRPAKKFGPGSVKRSYGFSKKTEG
jgi:hypothetical protein